jgi:hypothetical protein
LNVLRTYLLLAGLAGAAVLWALSKTQRGQVVASDAIEEVIVTAQRVADAFPNIRGIRNNNPGNIRWIASPGARWRGMIRSDGQNYGVFDTPENGIRAIGRQLRVYQQRGLSSPRAIISTWAPSTENNTAAYVAQVAKALGIGAEEQFNVSARLTALGLAIIKHENGVQPYAPEFVDTWMNAA